KTRRHRSPPPGRRPLRAQRRAEAPRRTLRRHPSPARHPRPRPHRAHARPQTPRLARRRPPRHRRHQRTHPARHPVHSQRPRRRHAAGTHHRAILPPPRLRTARQIRRRHRAPHPAPHGPPRRSRRTARAPPRRPPRRTPPRDLPHPPRPRLTLPPPPASSRRPMSARLHAALHLHAVFPALGVLAARDPAFADILA